MSFRARAATVIVFAIAMAYLEAAVVVYLQRAVGMTPADLFPLRRSDAMGNLAAIEVGREAATLVMLATIGLIAGTRGLDRRAWTSVAFGVWDIFYYAFLWVFLGWPGALTDWDVLFLIPVPWAGPIWAPILVSLLLIGFGLAAARRTLAGHPPEGDATRAALGIGGGVVVVLSFCAQAPALLDGGVPGAFPWPLFGLGIGISTFAVVAALRSPRASFGDAARV